MSDNDTPIEVDVNTDNLDDFDMLLSGRAVPKAEVEAEPEGEAAAEAAEVEAEEDVNPDDSPSDEPEDEGDPVEPADEDAEAEAEDEGEPEEDIVLPKKNRKSAKERINELTTEKYQEKARADLLERKLLELESRVSQLAPKEAPAATVTNDGRPDPDAKLENGELKYPLGEFDAAFIEDLTRHIAAKENAAYAAKVAAEAEANRRQEAEQKLVNSWQEKLTAAEEDYEDLRPAIAGLETEFGALEPEFGTYLAQTIMSMDLGPQVLYYLANNVNEARQIVAAGPAGATLALGRLEARIQSAMKKAATPTPRLTQAPTPAATTRGSGVKPSVKPDTDDLDAFERLYYNRK